MAKIIILNGPAGSGKDTLGKEIEWHSPKHVRVMAFKQPMFDIACAMLGPKTYEEFMEWYNDRDRKEKPAPFLGGMSPRNFMIWISETVIKPTFGNQHFGKLFNDAATGYLNTIVCTDGGFPDEVKALVEAGHEVKVLRLHREGYTFEGDSRNYISLPELIGVNGYEEADLELVSGMPMITVNEIIDRFII